MQICFNGSFYDEGIPLFTAANRGFKYGDGLFETMKVYRGRLLLADYHFERVLTGLRTLQIERWSESTVPQLLEAVLQLSRRNGCEHSARVRLAVYRTDDNKANWVAEAIPLPNEINEWTTEGLRLTLYPDAVKSTDAFSNLKTANYLPYVMAARFVELNGADDAVVLNGAGRLCDTSKANLFLLKAEALYTPALSEGCVAGVMRRTVLETARTAGYRVYETGLTEEDVLNADEVFLTNAIQMIRWVQRYKTSRYGCAQTLKIFDAVASTVFAERR